MFIANPQQAYQRSGERNVLSKRKEYLAPLERSGSFGLLVL